MLPATSPEAVAAALSGAPGFAWLDAPGGRSFLAAWPDREVRTFPRDPDPLPGLAADLVEGFWVLALGYDLGARMDRFPWRAKDDLGEPELEARRYPAVLIHEGGTWRVEGRDDGRLRRILESAAEPGDLPQAPTAVEVRRNLTREGYPAAVVEAKRLIREGEIYQANLAQRFQVPTSEAPFSVYRQLRRISPAPYSGFLNWGERAVLSASPELFLELKGRKILTRPIKGTRPRGRDEREDARLLAELAASEKDRAELAMIVDLERNDLGRVCAVGSVKVEETRKLESFAGVHHASASVSGTLREGAGLVDLLRATFPGGSVTGCPKIRAMEIIDRLEPTRRGIYCGAVGWARGGEACLNLAIRTMTLSKGLATLHAGAGIVADSDPEAEYRECLDKARGMLAALGAGPVL